MGQLMTRPERGGGFYSFFRECGNDTRKRAMEEGWREAERQRENNECSFYLSFYLFLPNSSFLFFFFF